MNQGSDHGVWVEDYVTSTGSHVAGHWRRRGEPTSARSAAEATPGHHTDLAEVQLSTRDYGPPTTSAPGKTGAINTGSERLAEAEQRYKRAQVGAGMVALRQRSGRGGDGDATVLSERVAAWAELNRLRSEMAPLPGRGAGSPNPTGNNDLPVPGTDPATGNPAGPAVTGDGGGRCASCGQFAGPGHSCPVPDALPDGDYSEVKGDDRVKAMLADLETSIQAIVQSGQLQRWLDAMASNGLERWSMNNRILALMQLMQRNGTIAGAHLMGFRQWEGFGRNVSKGAKAVWILAPVTRKTIDTDPDGNQVENWRVTSFRSVPVFDISDTHGDPLAAAPLSPATGVATPGTLEGLRDRVGAAGYTYTETTIDDCDPAAGTGTLGFTDPRTRRIVIDARLSDAQKASTLAHELGHVHTGHVDADHHEYEQHRGQMETEAEMTAYLVNRSRGMARGQVEAFSPGYIAAWAHGDTTMIHTAMDKATKASSKILDGNWPQPNGA